MTKVLIVGMGGLAKEFVTYFSEQISVVGYTTTNSTNHEEETNLTGKFFDYNVSPDQVGTDEAVIAIGHPEAKQTVSKQLMHLGFKFPSFIHPSSVLAETVNVEAGVIVSPNCVISPNVTLKAFAYVNFSCGIGHDAVIGRYVQINPGSQVGGFAIVGDGSLVGSSSTILQSINVGAGATIAAGSVVYSRVAAKATVMGNPAKRMRALEKQTLP